MTDQVDICMKFYKHCMNLAAELEIQLAFLEAAIKNEKIDMHLTIDETTTMDLDESDFERVE